MQKKSAKPSFSLGSMVTFLLLLLLIAGAVLLLIPQYRELRKKKEIEAQKNRELDALQNKRNRQKQENNDLSSQELGNPRTQKQIETGNERKTDAPRNERDRRQAGSDQKQLESKRDAVEKVGREKYNLVEEGDIVIKYTVPEQGK